MRGLRLVAAAALSAGLVVSSVSVATSSPDRSARTSTFVSTVRDATRPFHSLATAKRAGYTTVLKTTTGQACITNGAGDMGIHYVNGALLGDALLRIRKPEALMYEPTPTGKKLVAVEWVVFRQAWLEAGHTGAPRLWGHRLNLVPAGNEFGVPAFYELHAWIWKANPSGMFYEWNPRVHCP